jgi:hypothetical protein
MNRANYCVPWSAICAQPVGETVNARSGAPPAVVRVATRAIGGTRRGPTRRERVRPRPPVQSLCPLDAWRTLRDEPWRRYRHLFTMTEERVTLAGGSGCRELKDDTAPARRRGEGDTGFLAFRRHGNHKHGVISAIKGSMSQFRQNATVTGFVVLSGRRSLYRGRASRRLERVQLHADLVMLARCRGLLVEREPFRSRGRPRFITAVS